MTSKSNMKLILSLLVLAAPLTSVNAIALTFYRIRVPVTSYSTHSPTVSIEKPGTTIYTAVNPGSSGMVPWEVQEIADEVIVHLPSTTVTFSQPTTRVWNMPVHSLAPLTTDTITQGPYVEIANIPPVEGPVITPLTGPPVTLYENGFDRYCSINQSAKYGVCRETIIKPGGGSPTQPPTEVLTTRMYTGSLIPVTTIYTSLPS